MSLFTCCWYYVLAETCSIISDDDEELPAPKVVVATKPLAQAEIKK
jgi:hypothetical protein